MTRAQQRILLTVLTLGTLAVFAVGVAILVSMWSLPINPIPSQPPSNSTSPSVTIPDSLVPPSATPMLVLPMATNTLIPNPPLPNPLPIVPTTTSTNPAPPPTSDAWIEQRLASLTAADMIGQMIMMGVSGQTISTYTCQMIVDLAPGSVVYVGDNVVSPDQLRQFSADLQECNAQNPSTIPLWVALDHEGQYVFRFDYGATVFPTAMAFGATGNPDLAYQAAIASGKELAYSGVSMVLGPDADMLTNYDNDVISLRSYGSDPARVSEFVVRVVQGYQVAGLVSVLKHFPGHGGVASDSHDTLPVDTADLAVLRSSYLPPFQSGIGAGAPVIMFSHVAFPYIDPAGLPASLSPTLHALLRTELGFQGVILTDSMGMGAITNESNIPEACLQSVLAGSDMLLITDPEIATQTRDRLVSALQSGELPAAQVEAAVRRILTVKAAYGQTGYPLPTPPLPDWQANANLAFQAGYQALTLLRDTAGLLPLPGNRVLLIGPTDGWGMYPVIQSALQSNGYAVETYTYSGPWNGPVAETGYLVHMPVYSVNFDVTVVLTWQCHLNRLLYGDTFQASLVNNLLHTGRPVVVVALKSPVDLLDFPSAPTYLATFGTTPGQLQALADILAGNAVAVGVNPLPGLP
jgi:beta-N-acetylhexosaminidase